jgi:HEAT repeat protein
MGMRRWIFRNRARTRIPWLTIAASLYLAGALTTPPSAKAQDINERISSSLRDLKSNNALVRTQAAENLSISASPGSPVYDREQMRKAIPALTVALKDTDSSVRSAAAMALGNIPGDMRVTVPALINELQDKDESVRANSMRSLGKIGQCPELAVPALVGGLNRGNSGGTRESASEALIRFGPAAKPAVPALIALLNENDLDLDVYVAPVLGAIGPEAQDAEPALLAILRGSNDQVRLEAADALGKIGRDQAEAVAVTTPILEAEDWQDRMRAAGVLKDLGPSAATSVPALTRALKDEDGDVRRAAAVSLAQIATALRDGGRTEAIEPLQNAAAAMEQSPDSRVKANAHRSVEAIAALQNIRSHDVKWRLQSFVRERPRAALAVSGYLALALLWACLLWLWPISLLKVGEALEAVPKVSLPGWLGGMQISVSHLLLVGFFRQSDRVLDAWVARHLEKARASFESSGAVTKRTDAVLGPMLLDGELLTALSVNTLRPAFARQKTRMLIWGSDDNTNTNLACEIGRWSMEFDPQRRLRKNLMIAVRVGRNFSYTADKDTDPFTCAVRDKLQFDEEATSAEFVTRLLKRQRVLVIILGFSELNEPTQASIQPGNANFPANALVVTSRVEEALGGVGKTVIQFSEEIRL